MDIFSIVKSIAPSDCKLRKENDGIYIDGHLARFPMRIRLCDEDCHFVRNLPAFKTAAEANGLEWTYRVLDTIHGTWRMATSLYAYSYPLSKPGADVIEAEAQNYYDYLANYKIPKEVKAVVLDAVRNSIEGVMCGVATDPEGCVYNSINYKKMN